MEPNLENEGAKGCYQIVKSNDLESTRLTMSSFLLLYGLWLHPVETKFCVGHISQFQELEIHLCLRNKSNKLTRTEKQHLF